MESFSDRPKLSKNRMERIEAAIDKLENPLRTILLEISPKIERGEYSTVIGVDASGRIPALVISGVIKNRYQALGHEKLNVLFIAGGSKNKMSGVQLENKKRNISEYLQTLIEEGMLTADKKALVVEDTAISGESVRLITDVLSEKQINSEVIIVAGNEHSAAEWSEIIQTPVYSTRDFEASVYGKNDMSGVSKKHHELFARPRYSRDGNLALNETRSRVANLIEKLTPIE